MINLIFQRLGLLFEQTTVKKTLEKKTNISNWLSPMCLIINRNTVVESTHTYIHTYILFSCIHVGEIACRLFLFYLYIYLYIFYSYVHMYIYTHMTAKHSPFCHYFISFYFVMVSVVFLQKLNCHYNECVVMGNE